MPFYRMMCIAAHYPEYVSLPPGFPLEEGEWVDDWEQKHIKDLVTQSAMHVLDNGGTVRGLRYWGTLTLPQRMRRQKQIFNYGEYVPSFPPSTTDLVSTLRKFSREKPLPTHPR